jgi:GntP family gluconate:H+ symporter
MVSGELALLLLVLAVALIAVLAGRYKVHPFIAMLGAAFAYGLAIGVPAPELVRQVKGGFGGTLASLGIVILAGTMLGGILHGTGAARVISRGIFRLLGARRAPLAANLSGALVSIPVPCDAAFVLLNPLQKTLATETRIPPAVLSVALATGLYATRPAGSGSRTISATGPARLPRRKRRPCTSRAVGCRSVATCSPATTEASTWVGFRHPRSSRCS